jgi:hypothetical protein
VGHGLRITLAHLLTKGRLGGGPARLSATVLKIGTRFSIPAIVAVLVAVAVAACGSSGSSGNGVAAKSPSQILTAASSALEHASSVHVSGEETTGGQTTSLDLHIASGKGATGTLAEGGLSFKLILVDNEVYIYGSPAFLQHFAGSSAAALFKGKWIKAPAAGGAFGDLSSLTNLKEFAEDLLTSHGPLTKGPSKPVNGHPAVALVDSSKGTKLYVATTGTPYPIEVTKGSDASQHVAFDSYNVSVSLTPPANAIDVSKLHG